MEAKAFETIYFHKGDSQTDEPSVFIGYIERLGVFEACTKTQYKTFKTLLGARKWMEKKGYTIPIKE